MFLSLCSYYNVSESKTLMEVFSTFGYGLCNLVPFYVSYTCMCREMHVYMCVGVHTHFA